MKNSNPRLSLLFGVSAFMLFSLCSSALAQGGAQPLKEVTHDGTLDGKGTAAEPLKVKDRGVDTVQLKDGAVTLSKVNTAGVPAGHMLTVTATGAAWSAPPVGSGTLRVVDSIGNEVGIYTEDTTSEKSYVIRYTQALDVWWRITVNEAGFRDFSGPSEFQVLYESSDCSGTAYALVNPDFTLVRLGVVSNGIIYLGAGTVIQRSLNSTKDIISGNCQQLSTQNEKVALLISFPVSDLGLTPPFRVSR